MIENGNRIETGSYDGHKLNMFDDHSGKAKHTT